MSETPDVILPVTTERNCEPCQTPPSFVAVTNTSNGLSEENKIFDYPTQNPPASTVLTQVEERPTKEPPSQFLSQGEAVAAGWQTNKKIVGLWSYCSEGRNAWMYVDGVGWRKFADNSDSAIVAFNMIAAHAKATGKGANFYEGDDGKVNTLYVW
ncbi:hypothetical protein F7734_14620 [Scytonema sp. UIC 10036]|uniref:hypothetical protein n=1 Tax=Scytonema sp. UIC 10036 TaxID=2304196 RepID=UPI0012DAE5AB|nr:hypothetical protein [Scytonema sp. UIC 10036]MUG93590.1 hypothetical protein [Scytonema sp. UIC 10036]